LPSFERVILYDDPMVSRVPVFLLASAVFAASTANGQTESITSAPNKPYPSVIANLRQSPLSFEANEGHIASGEVQYVAHGQQYGIALTSNGAVLSLNANGGKAACFGSAHRAPECRQESRDAELKPVDVILLRLQGGGSSNIIAENPLRGRVNYLVGNDPSRWRTGLPTYGSVRYAGVYPGVDLVYYGTQGRLEYDFIVAPGGDTRPIRLKFEGAQQCRLDRQGDLVIRAKGGEIGFEKPVVYQVREGKHETVNGTFKIVGKREVGFIVGPYDRTRPLVIDPVLAYSTYLGGSTSDSATAIAVDASGSAYVTGYTSSNDFPITASAVQTTNKALANQAYNVFVTKFTADGSGLAYSTYLGGSGQSAAASGGVNFGDSPSGIAIDSTGSAYVTGFTYSLDFPVTSGAFQTLYPGKLSKAPSAFVTKLSPAGDSLTYSTYLGGSGGNPLWTGGDTTTGIAVDPSGSAYVAGTTSSPDFPVTPGAFQTSFTQSSQYTDGFVVKVNPSGSALAYATFFGGPGAADLNLGPSAIAVNSSGNAYLVGNTNVLDFPTTPGAFQPTVVGINVFFDYIGYVTELDPKGATLVYSTYFAESSQPMAAALDAAGNVYITGTTTGSLPLTSGAFQTTPKITPFDIEGHPIAVTSFVASLNPTLSGLNFSTYLGGSTSYTTLNSIGVDAKGNTWVTGSSNSTFPITPDAIQSSLPTGTSCLVIASLNPTGTTLRYSSFFCGPAGGAYSEAPIALDPAGNAYVAGGTLGNFPVSSNAFQKVNNTAGRSIGCCGSNAIVYKLDTSDIVSVPSIGIDQSPPSLTISSPGASSVSSLQVSSINGFSGTVNISCTVVYQGTGTATSTPTCTPNPNQATVAANAAIPVTLTVGSTSAAASVKPFSDGWQHPLGAMAAFLIIGFITPRKKKRIALFVILGCIAYPALNGCSSGTPASHATTPGTTTGNYLVAVTATSGALTSSVKIPLTVQ
jgi:Beta-propeller repeat